MEQHVRGREVFVKILDGATKRVLAGQKSASLSRSAATIDATTKNSRGWERKVAGLKNWGISCDGLYVENEEAYNTLLTAFNEGRAVDVLIEGEDGSEFSRVQSGKAIITDFPLEYAGDGLVEYSAEFEGDGELTDVRGASPQAMQAQTAKVTPAGGTK